MILITGCTGYIGSQIAYALNKNKIKFIGIDNLKYSYYKNFKLKNKFFKINISNRKVEKIIQDWKIKTVIHCAAYAYVNEGEKNKKKYILNNVINTKKFINFCEINNVQNFIFLSSSNVYDDDRKLEFKRTKINPKNIYGKNKIDIENFLKKKKFKSKVILRLFNIIGLKTQFYVYKPKIRYQRIFFKFLDKRFIPKLKFFLVNNLKIFPKRDFVDISDLTDLIIRIIKKLKEVKINRTFDVGSGKSKSILFLYKKFNKIKKIPLPSFEQLRKEELFATQANINITKNYFKWRPVVKLDNSINSLIKLIKI